MEKKALNAFLSFHMKMKMKMKIYKNTQLKFIVAGINRV